MLHDDHLLQAMHAAGVRGRNVVYVSVPITSGARELALLEGLGATSSDEVRSRDPGRWVDEVRDPNERDAAEWAEQVRQASWVPKGFIVVNPSRIRIEGWEQDDYNRFWVRLMQEHVRLLVPTPGWEFSRGARTEVGYALSFDPSELELVDVDGVSLSRDDVRKHAEAARQMLADRGWPSAAIDSYLPPLMEAQPSLAPSPQSQAFGWLVDERRFQVRTFGSKADDERTRSDGWAPTGWWSSQMHRYEAPGSAGDLADPQTRLYLAKFVSTAVGLLESAIRVFGELPSPGNKRVER